MSSNLPVIELEGVSKSFRITASGQASRWKGLRGGPTSSFTAVDDVSFAVQPGELVGLVGANGAGKSTLLKLLSRVMHPDTGRITLGGPVTSLLEVGAGFHPELTARENVYLNGAILGLDAKAVRRSFDDIVSLAGVEPFLETPVKRLSSGMKVRLAVAVGLHLDSDAIILDEVLAVGDAVFQRRCLETLDAMSASGRRATVLVSHNMQTIQQVCRRVLVMHKGQLIFDGDPGLAVAEYFAQVSSAATPGLQVSARTNPHNGGRLVVTGARLIDAQGEALRPVCGGSLGVEVELDLAGVEQPATLGIRFMSRGGQLLAGAEHLVELADDSAQAGGQLTTRWHADVMPLAAGQYALTVVVTARDGSVADLAEQVIPFAVTDPAVASDSLAAGLAPPHVLLDGGWSHEVADQRTSAAALTA